MHLVNPLTGLTLLAVASSLVAGLPTQQEQQQLTFNAPAALASHIEPIQLTDDRLRRLLDEHIASLPERRLVRLSEDGPALAISEGEKALLTLQGKKFVDVTDEEEIFIAQAKEPFPEKLSYKVKDLAPLFDDINVKAMRTFLTKFSSFRTRYYRSETGKESQQYLLKTLKSIASSNSKLSKTISIKEFPHPWGQNSIIVRFEPDERTSDSIVILGAHQDSTNMLPFLGAPGADDDGSGTTTLVEAFAVLVNHTFVPSTHPVEFQFASAEEGGLLGSQAMAQQYAKDGKKVRSMVQFDMTAFVREGTKPTIGLIRDFVDPSWTEHVAKVIDEYAEIGYTDTKCGYACSDHASWSKIGAPSAFTIESTFENSNHDIHSSRDTIDNPGFSFEHAAQFTRLAIALAVEMGGGESLGLKNREE